ncbi:MAG: DUF805 domain-containing protein [Campylobacteraceae bacterium]|jgi:uncharacterized membrane protein YhaH (DUF805 family)|nr:DUF805 domain-containing protein [Campylobacteraceae bacterium]
MTTISRSKFFILTIIILFFSLICQIVVSDFIRHGKEAIAILSIAILFALKIWAILLFVWRLHDINHSGWWALLMCIPYVGLFTGFPLWLYLMLKKGIMGKNRDSQTHKDINTNESPKFNSDITRKQEKSYDDMKDFIKKDPKLQFMYDILNLQANLSEASGTNQDIMPEGFGEFGHEATNPIPVCTIFGNDVYLNRLRTLDGQKITYNRTKSLNTKNIPIVDEYQIFSGTQQIATLYICPYNKAISNKAPKGFKLYIDPKDRQ